MTKILPCNPLKVTASIISPCILILIIAKLWPYLSLKLKSHSWTAEVTPRHVIYQFSLIGQSSCSSGSWYTSCSQKFCHHVAHDCQATLSLKDLTNYTHILIWLDCYHLLVIAVVGTLSGTKDRAYWNNVTVWNKKSKSSFICLNKNLFSWSN